jgi:N-acetylmuramoyl-L-alanine amidase
LLYRSRPKRRKNAGKGAGNTKDDKKENNDKKEEIVIEWLIDNGHGSLDPNTCEPVTPGKRSPIFPEGSKFEGQRLIEGVRNRVVVNYLTLLLEEHNIRFRLICDDWKDCSLSSRTQKANQIVRDNKDPELEFVFLSIHHNAFRGDWNQANGVSCHVFPGSKKGHEFGEVFQRQIVDATGLKDRGVKENNFYVLRNTICPAVLTENGFMTNLHDASFCMSEEGSRKIAVGHFAAIEEINYKNENK